MRLLKPQEDNEVSPEKKKKTEELSLIEKAISEQNKILNELWDEERIERERIAKEHGEFVSQKKSEKKEIEKDVGKILAIKALALEPLDQKKKELNEREKVIVGKELLLSKKEERVKSESVGVYETAAKSKLMRDDAMEREKELDEREKKLKSEEKEFEGYRTRQKDLIGKEWAKVRARFEKSQNKGSDKK